MILRCSVIRSPFSAQSASISICRVIMPRTLGGESDSRNLAGGCRRKWRRNEKRHPGPAGVALPKDLQSRRLLANGALALGAEADLLGQGAALLGIIGRDHRIVGVEAPLLPIFVRCHVV